MDIDPSLPTSEERTMLRDSIRRNLTMLWPAEGAAERCAQPEAVLDAWSTLASQGIFSLGKDKSEGGLSEILVVTEELGRSHCPVPLVGAVIANLTGWDFDETSRITVGLSSESSDTGYSNVKYKDGTVSGQVDLVEVAASATHILIAIENLGFAIVEISASGCSLSPARALGGNGFFHVRFSHVPARLLELSPSRMADIELVVRLCAASIGHGAARRSFELAVEYVKERHQFGRPIGSFQAIQHKLADCLIQLNGVKRTLENAASNFDRNTPDWQYYSSAAIAYAATALPVVSLQIHHAFGAVGYAEEHEAPRHFRTVHLSALRHGGVRVAREQLAARLLDEGNNSLPLYDLGEKANALRLEVRKWLSEHWTGARKAAFDKLPFWEREFDRQFARDLGSTGWIGLTWPHKHGGQERSINEQIAFMEEMERAEVPRYGAPIQANALMTFGTPEQQARYLPEILRGEVMHGIGYSEPNAGSDLAALRTTAARDGNDWVINGQKIWTTTYWGQYMFLAARTNPTAAPKHAGLSTFIFPMNTPGITISTSRTLYDGTFANIFYDNVRVPADALVGKENGGWEVLTNALATERGLIGGGIVLKVAHLFELLCSHVRNTKVHGRPLSDDALVRDQIGTIAADIEVGRQLMMQCAELVRDGVTPPEYGAISKVFCSELMERFGETALSILGERAVLSQQADGCIENGKFEQGLRHSLMWVISMGTNEIQRSLIAQRALQLPR